MSAVCCGVLHDPVDGLGGGLEADWLAANPIQ